MKKIIHYLLTFAFLMSVISTTTVVRAEEPTETETHEDVIENLEEEKIEESTESSHETDAETQEEVTEIVEEDSLTETTEESSELDIAEEEIEVYSIPSESGASEAIGESVAKIKLWRLYNRNSGEHFYTSSTKERDSLYDSGWNIEGYGWQALEISEMPIYRLYNPIAGDHHYTASVAERDHLVFLGWKDEKIAWYASSRDAESAVPVYREYNPNAKSGAHNFTTSINEHNRLISVGWKDEGIAFYVAAVGGSEGARKHPVITGANVVEKARSWIGVGRYAYGGTNPSTGADCSGFTQYVYSQVGISINRLAHEQAWNGYKVSNPQPGDLVLWTGHAAIYSGNGNVINAMNAWQGIQEIQMARLSASGTFLGYYHVYGVE